MKNPLDLELLSVDDVLLVPNLGRLSSRSEAEINAFMFSAPMDTVTGFDLASKLLSLGEYATISRFLPKKELNKCIKHFMLNERCFFAIGAKSEDLADFINLVYENLTEEQAETDITISVAIDIAHGDSMIAHQAAQWLSQNIKINIMSGSICTPAGAIRAVESGCTHLRVGVGPGSQCQTRMMTGVGMPQLSAVYLINQAITERFGAKIREHITIIADGGIRHPGDAVKYLAAGADAVMLGSRFAQCVESPGWKEGTKQYRGQASASFQEAHYGRPNPCPEGTTSQAFAATSTVEEVVNEFRGGLASAISYLGVTKSIDLTPANVSLSRLPMLHTRKEHLMDSKAYIFVIGDPIIDNFYEGHYVGNQFVVTHNEWRTGGSFNVIANLDSILPEEATYACPSIRLIRKYYELNRLIDTEKNRLSLFSLTKETRKAYFYADKELDAVFKAHLTWQGQKILILSDYNKGMVNGHNLHLSSTQLPEFKCCIADTRYRTLDLQLTRTSKVKIWHATGDEYDQEYAQNFDYTLWTNGPEHVWILPTVAKSTKDWHTLSVPNTKVVDACGAGDTFVAAVAAYLSKQIDINLQSIQEATAFAIECCQDVIQIKYTAVTQNTLS